MARLKALCMFVILCMFCHFSLLSGQAFIRGDANSDGTIDLSDPISILSYLFTDGTLKCRDAGDANDSGGIDLADAIYDLSYLFADSLEPPSPFPECGLDPTEDALDCAASPSCIDPSDDTDGDGLTNEEELIGWEVRVDLRGYGLLDDVTVYNVTSDPENADTDGDGLDDYQEKNELTDPRKADTDGDFLSDSQEYYRWDTNAISVDSDEDCRGPNKDHAPDRRLFDGAELGLEGPAGDDYVPPLGATSPRLKDTDGDARTDFEEMVEGLGNPVLADLPKVELEIEDDIYVGLNITYEDGGGTEVQYGSAISKGETNSVSSSASVMAGIEVGTKVGLSVSGGMTAALPDTTVTNSVEIGFTAKLESSVRCGYESSQALQSEYSKYATDSQSYTETVATGTLAAGLRITNPGEVAFRIDDFGLAIRAWEQHVDLDTGDVDGRFKTVGTLNWALQGGISIPPGGSHFFALENNDINADIIKGFLENPTSLYLETPYYNLTGRDEIDFPFLEEVTQTRTATLAIEYGDGIFETYRIATNVNREWSDDDEDYIYPGVNVQNLMVEYLDIDVITHDKDLHGNTIPRILTKVDGLPELPEGEELNPFDRWILVGDSPQLEDPSVHFEDLILRANESLMLVRVTDSDQDGLNNMEEELHGIDDPEVEDPKDFDGDGLLDYEEVGTRLGDDTECEEPPCWIVAGWEVSVVGLEPYHVFSDPQTPDGDGDGLNDYEEREGGTDPHKPDTDNDGLQDDIDPAPLYAAATFYVKQDGNDASNGLSWDTAYASLEAATNEVYSRNIDGDPENDIAEIWVAAGAYETENAMALPNDVGLYGGFEGGEESRGERKPDPNDSDRNKAWITPKNGGVHRAFSFYQRKNIVIDGFSIKDFKPSIHALEYGAAVRIEDCDGILIRNTLFQSNKAVQGEGGAIWAAVSRGGLIVENCIFLHNSAAFSGGAIYFRSPADSLTIRDCIFDYNSATLQGGALSIGEGSVDIVSTLFQGNEAGKNEADELSTTGWGGAIAAFAGTGRVKAIACRFLENMAIGLNVAEGGAVWCDSRSEATMFVNCVFWLNRCEAGIWNGGKKYPRGSALHLVGPARITNCTIIENSCISKTNALTAECGALSFQYQTKVELYNSVLALNDRRVATGPATYVSYPSNLSAFYSKDDRVHGDFHAFAPTQFEIWYSCAYTTGPHPIRLDISAQDYAIEGPDLITIDPLLSEGDDKPKPAPNSPLIDGGLNDVDIGAYEIQ